VRRCKKFGFVCDICIVRARGRAMSHTVSSAGSLHVVSRCLGITGKSSRSAGLVPSLLARRSLFPLSIANQVGSQAGSRGGQHIIVQFAARAETGGESLP